MALLIGSSVELLPQLRHAAESSNVMVLPLKAAGAVQRSTVAPLMMWKLPFQPPLQKLSSQLVLTVKTVLGFWKAEPKFLAPKLPLVRIIPTTSLPIVTPFHSP